MEVVDEDQKDAAGRIVRRARRWQQQALLRIAGGTTSLKTWPPCVSTNVTISCLTPSS
jgi:hypothetical protein